MVSTVGHVLRRAPTVCTGEYPLFFAACTNQARMVNVLVSAGADLSAVDSNGNTLLHLLVHHELTDMYDHVVELWKAQHGITKDTERDSECVSRGRVAAVWGFVVGK